MTANEELRERMAEQIEFALSQTPEALQAENAKLRELVDYMTPIALYAASERERDRMRELGVEVDG